MGPLNLCVSLLIITTSQSHAEFIKVLSPVSQTNLNENAPSATNATSTTYFLQGVPPKYEVFHSSKYANLTNLKELILLEYVSLEATDFLDFLQLHSATLESITLHKVKVYGNFRNKTKVYLPKLKSFYANIANKRGQDWQDPYAVMMFTTNNETMSSWEWRDVWLQRVNLVIILDGKLYFEIDHDAGILKSQESEILQSVDTPLTTIALTSTGGDKLGPVKYPEHVETLVLKSLIDAAGKVDTWIKQFTNLKSLSYSPSPFGPTDLTLLPGSLKNLTLTFTSLLPRGPMPSKPVALDHLNLDCDIRINGLDRYYNAKRVSMKEYYASLPMLKSVMRMTAVKWIYYEYEKVNWGQHGVSKDIQQFLEDLGTTRKNFTSFILEKDDTSSKIWAGRYVDDAEKLQIKKNLLNIQTQFDTIITKLSKDTDQLVSNRSRTKNISGNHNSLLLEGLPAIYAKPDYSIVGLKNITFLSYVNLESDKFAHFLQSNNQTLESIQLFNVTRSGKFNQTISLPKLKQLIIHNEIIVRDADYKSWTREDNILSSLIAFITTTKNISSQKNTSFESIVAENVDISFVENDIQLFHINHTSGILKSRINRGYDSTKMNEKVLYATRENSTWLRTIALSDGEISHPPPATFNPANVTKLILHQVEFSNFTQFIQKFGALRTLIFQQSRSYQPPPNFTFLPQTLEKLTLQNAQLEIPSSFRTNADIQLLELNLIECRYSYGDDANIDGIFNAKNITLVSRYPPTELLTSVTNMTKAEWIFVAYSNANVRQRYLDAWKNLVKKFGLMG